MRLRSLFIGLALTLFSACQTQIPRQDAPENVPEPVSSSSSTATGGITDVLNETTPDTIDSLEIGKVVTGTVLPITQLSGSILMGEKANKILTIYDDYECFYCREFGMTDLPWLLQTYGDHLTVERVFVPKSPAGTLMAKVAICSEKQGLFRETDKALHMKPILSETEIPAFAKSVKLNLKSLQACMASKVTVSTLEASSVRAKAAGITRFPSFELGTDGWIGILTREELRKKIENAL